MNSDPVAVVSPSLITHGLLRWALYGLLGLMLPGQLAAPRSSFAVDEITGREQILRDDATLRAVQMIGPRIGYAVGEWGVIKKTTDGGQTWNLLAPPLTCRWDGLCFLTDQIGWVAGGTITADGRTSRGCLLQTRDGGATWQELTLPAAGMLRTVRFFDLQQGVIVGAGSHTETGGIWRTVDGGKTWQGVLSTQVESWNTAAFPGPEGGVVAGSAGQLALVAGTRLLNDRVTNYGLRGIHGLTLDGSASGWLVGDGGLVRYAPAGAAWQDPPGPLPLDLELLFDFRAVSQVGTSVWLAGHPGSAIWKSADGGQTWRMIPTPVTVPLNAIHFADSQNGIAVGELGTILKTSDGGESWQVTHGADRRLALLQLVTTASEAAFCLTARYGGDGGYRSGVIALCQTVSAADASQQPRPDSELALQAGMVLTGGNLAGQYWTLPLDAPDLRGQTAPLIERWNRATDDQLSERVLAHLVRDLRTYRPTVVVIDTPREEDQAGQLLRSAILNAIRFAGDPTWMVSQQQYAALAPWQVSRVFERRLPGQTGDVNLSHAEYLPGLNQSARMAAGPASALVGRAPHTIALHEVFALVPLDGENARATGNDLFSGIVLGPGGPARRPLGEINPAFAEAGAALARQQRNFSAYARTALADEQQGAQMIAQLQDVIGRSPPRHAVQQLLELAETYRKNGQWSYYETMLMQAIENYPTEPLTATAAADLILLWASAEMTQFRLRDRRTSVTTRQIDGLQVQADVADVLQTAAEFSELPAGAVTPAVRETPRAAAQTQGSQHDRGAWRKTWQDRALAVYSYLQKLSPETARRDDVQLALASLYRQRGASRGVQEVYQQYLKGQYDPEAKRPLLQQIAEGEFWLQARTGLSPRNYRTCLATAAAPYLDGVLSDLCWQQADEIRLEFPRNASLPPTAQQQPPAMVMLAYDAKYLYLAGSFPRMPGVTTEPPWEGGREHDTDLSGFDRLQLAIDIDRDYQSSFVFEVDQRGLTAERCWQEARWNPEWFVACAGDATHWRVEIAIPLDQLTESGTIAPDTVWGVSLARLIPGVGIQSATRQAGESPQPAAFGLVHFR